MAHWFAPASDFDPKQEIYFVEVNENIAGYGTFRTRQETSGMWTCTPIGRVLPAWRRKGLGRAMLRYNEHRLRTIASTHPADGPRAFMVWASNTNLSAITLYIQEGYVPVRHAFVMVRDKLDDIPTASLPEGIQIRAVTPEHYRQIWEAECEALQEHWGITQPTEEGYHHWLNDPVFDPTLWRVAWEGNQVVAQVRSFILPEENKTYNRLRGYTENISVRKPWRKRGIARALISASLEALKERGMTQAALRVDTQNADGALNLYESCGYRVERKQTEYRKPLE
jgi:GNAT superfamily N-acetyltransferase